MKRLTEVYIKAAEKLGIDIEILDEESSYVSLHSKGKEFKVKSSMISLNNQVCSTIVKNKFFTIKILKNLNCPTPDSAKFIKEDLEKIKADAVNKIPCVVKPNKRSQGSFVFAGLTSVEQIDSVLKIIEENLHHNEEVVVENFVSGKEFRILLFQGKIIDIIERVPAFVEGNGESSIEELIKLKNEKRKELGTDEIINIDNKLIMKLKESGLELQSIPSEEDGVIKLRNTCNFADGGETKRIDISTIHADNLEMFKKVVKELDLTLCGLDLIIPDITKSYKVQKCCINELNSSPDLTIHYYADFEQNNIAVEKILKEYFLV